jgi:hypothetical protein
MLRSQYLGPRNHYRHALSCHVLPCSTDQTDILGSAEFMQCGCHDLHSPASVCFQSVSQSVYSHWLDGQHCEQRTQPIQSSDSWQASISFLLVVFLASQLMWWSQLTLTTLLLLPCINNTPPQRAGVTLSLTWFLPLPCICHNTGYNGGHQFQTGW